MVSVEQVRKALIETALEGHLSELGFEYHGEGKYGSTVWHKFEEGGTYTVTWQYEVDVEDT